MYVELPVKLLPLSNVPTNNGVPATLLAVRRFPPEMDPIKVVFAYKETPFVNQVAVELTPEPTYKLGVDEVLVWVALADNVQALPLPDDTVVPEVIPGPAIFIPATIDPDIELVSVNVLVAEVI
jgi:hypothetical protein